MIAFLVVGAFVIFVFFGKEATCKDDELYRTVLTAFGTLTGAVTGFYFGGRGSEARDKPKDEKGGKPTGEGEGD